MSDTPLVSIVIPVKNVGPLIAGALDSALSQSYQNREILVIDQSDDNGRTYEVIENYLGQIRYLTQSQMGASSARNLGITESRGDLVAFLDADDTWYPEKLKLQVAAWREYPDVGVIFSDTLVIGEGPVERILSTFSGSEWFADARTRKRKENILYRKIYSTLLTGNFIHTSSVCVPKSILSEAPTFDTELRICEDLDLWLRICRTRPAVCVDTVLCTYLQRSESLSGTTSRDRARTWNLWTAKVLDRQLRNNEIPKSHRSLAKNSLATHRIRGLCFRILDLDFISAQKAFKEIRRDKGTEWFARYALIFCKMLAKKIHRTYCQISRS